MGGIDSNRLFRKFPRSGSCNARSPGLGARRGTFLLESSVPRRIAIPVTRFFRRPITTYPKREDRRSFSTDAFRIGGGAIHHTPKDRMPASSIWGHPHTVTAPSPSKTQSLPGPGNPFSQSSSRPTPIGTPTKQQQFYHQQAPSSFTQQQTPYNPRLSTSSSASSTNSAAAAGMPMSPGQISTSSTSAGGASVNGMGHEGSIYLSAASSLTGVGLGTMDSRVGNEVDHNGNLHAESGYTIRDEANFRSIEDAAPMRMPLNLEEEDEEEHAYARGQGYLANPSINLFQHADDAYLVPQQSQPVSIPLSSPGRLAPGMVGGPTGGTTDHYDAHSGQQQMYAVSPGGATTPLGASAGNSGHTLQQPSPSRAIASVGVGSISPLPWGRNNGPSSNNNNHHHHHHANNGRGGPNQVSRNGGLGGGMTAQNASNGFERPTSAMSSRGYGYGEPGNQRDGLGSSGKETAGGNGNSSSNANGLQGIGIARADSPAMAVSSFGRALQPEFFLNFFSVCNPLCSIGAHCPGREDRSCTRRSQSASSIAEHARQRSTNICYHPESESFRWQPHGLEWK